MRELASLIGVTRDLARSESQNALGTSASRHGWNFCEGQADARAGPPPEPKQREERVKPSAPSKTTKKRPPENSKASQRLRHPPNLYCKSRELNLHSWSSGAEWGASSCLRWASNGVAHSPNRLDQLHLGISLSFVAQQIH